MYKLFQERKNYVAVNCRDNQSNYNKIFRY